MMLIIVTNEYLIDGSNVLIEMMVRERGPRAVFPADASIMLLSMPAASDLFHSELTNGN